MPNQPELCIYCSFPMCEHETKCLSCKREKPKKARECQQCLNPVWIGDKECRVCNLWNLIEEIGVKVQHAMPYHPDPGVNRSRACKSPATIMVNAEVLKDYIIGYKNDIARLEKQLNEYESNDGSD